MTSGVGERLLMTGLSSCAAKVKKCDFVLTNCNTREEVLATQKIDYLQ
jgi:hypothetical protein